MLGGVGGAAQAITAGQSIGGVAAATGMIGGAISGALVTTSGIVGAGISGAIAGIGDLINQSVSNDCINWQQVGAQGLLGAGAGFAGGKMAGAVFGQMANPGLRGSAYGAAQIAQSVGAAVSNGVTAGANSTVVPSSHGGF